jgi:hypothetical protein
MTTGMHVVSDISCTKCCALLGWKYVSISSAAGALGTAAVMFDRVAAALPDSHRSCWLAAYACCSKAGS